MWLLLSEASKTKLKAMDNFPNQSPYAFRGWGFVLHKGTTVVFTVSSCKFRLITPRKALPAIKG